MCLCSSQARIPISIYVSAAHFFRGAATGSSAHLQSAGSAELVPCTLVAAAAAPWDIARECPAGAAAPYITDVMPFAVLRLSRRLPACTLAPDAPPLGANVTALGYGLLPAGLSSTLAHSRALPCACNVTCDACCQAPDAASCTATESFRMYCASAARGLTPPDTLRQRC
jgi:hypothetical protein